MPYVLREQIFQKNWKNINKPKKILARNISNLVKLSLRQSQRRREKNENPEASQCALAYTDILYIYGYPMTIYMTNKYISNDNFRNYNVPINVL